MDAQASWNMKLKILKDLKALIAKEAPAAERKDLLTFADGFYTYSAPEDVLTATVADLYAQLRSMWALGAKRKPGKPNIRIFNTTRKRDGWESEHTIIQIVNDDMPFLVDSITGGLSVTQKLDLHVVHHPLFVIERDAGGVRRAITGSTVAGDKKKPAGAIESYMYIEVDAQSGTGTLKAIEARLKHVLSDVRAAVKDFRGMVAKIDETVASLTVHAPPIDDEETQETIAYLRWMSANNFTFIGYREYRFKGDPRKQDFKVVQGMGLGILRDPSRFILRGRDGFTAISEEIRDFLAQPGDPIIITKANVKSDVHRQVHLDYIGVKIYDKNGKVIGERRFAGLFTSYSYSTSPLDVPLLRKKVAQVQAKSRLDERSHAGKALLHILENFPRDELFQTSVDQLFVVGMGVLHLLERPRTRAFLRKDKFERFVSALVYVPRDRYNTALRSAIEKVLCEAVNGEISVHYAQLSNDVVARWHFIIRTKPGMVREFDEQELDAAITHAAKDWKQHLREHLIATHGEEEGIMFSDVYANVFSEGYKEDFEPRQARIDIEHLQALEGQDDTGFDIYRRRADPEHAVRLKIFHCSRTIPLSDCLPMLENMGFRVIRENSYEFQDNTGATIHDFYMETRDCSAIDAGALEARIEELLQRIWEGEVEDDGFNALAVTSGFGWRKIVLLRAYAKYLKQLGQPFSQDYVENCLRENITITEKLVDLFAIQFSPDFEQPRLREKLSRELKVDILQMLDGVKSLDQDRILRNYVNVIRSTLRTNYYQDAYLDQNGTDDKPAPGLAFKIASERVEEAPKPRPFREIFVYSARVEGVHLRGGEIARGGLRWSDRPEDFRTEVLGLVKAQQVKNAVIVPVGAKGGFFPKKLPATGGREAFMAEGIVAYKIFITTLLSITDNLVKGRTRSPKGVLKRDGNDPYLVVAADKGTAAFSDMANGIAIDRGFWLGDAFASGGSNGYDHKKMGITAKGAWVSVQRHFREIGVDVQKDPVSVVGVGDMSGDVFGNGMLLSRTIELKAAFDHRHIFLDPNPDPVASFRERKRLFRLERSSWEDYDSGLISAGGGVYPRSVKSIPLSPQVKELLDVDHDAMSPQELMHHILKAPADLLWFGGIGTYVKASYEANADVGDRANNLIRVDATELNVKAIGEGGNLGITQEARIQFGMNGGRINTDFIDNSAGVDCSDKEVNIKILLTDAEQSGLIDMDSRNILLAEMTPDVSRIVLEDNYLQTGAISIAEARSVKARERHAALIRFLERGGRLDRKIENLPTIKQFTEMGENQLGLSRPEISTILAYSKMWVFDNLLDSPLINDPVLEPELAWGFPQALRDRFPEQMKRHQLKRHIIATTLANQIINRAGVSFVHEIHEETGHPVDEIAAAYLIARDVFGLTAIWEAIDALDYKVPTTIQTLMHVEVSSFLKRQTTWFLNRLHDPFQIAAALTTFQKGIGQLLAKPEQVLSPPELASLEAKLAMYREEKVPRSLARTVASLDTMGAACDIVSVSDRLKRQVSDVGRAFFEVGHLIGFDWLRRSANSMVADDHWERMAVNAMIDDLNDQQRSLSALVLAQAGREGGGRAVRAWLKKNEMLETRTTRLLGDVQASGALTVAKLSFAVRQLRGILPRED